MEMTEAVLHLKFGIPFLFFQRPEWDKFPGAVHTYAADTLMPDGRVLQLPSTHLLGTNFAKAFNVYYQDEKGGRSPVWQTCYGPAISRIYGALFSVHGDNKGLVLPFDFAPVQVVIVPILGKGQDGSAVLKYAQAVGGLLTEAGLRTRVDSSPNTPGFKYNQWEMQGVPIRVEIGGREAEGKELTLVVRDAPPKTKKTIALDSAVSAIRTEGSALSSRLLAKADAYFDSHLAHAKDMDGLKAALEKGCIVRVPYCSMEKKEGKACADEIKAKLVGDVRGIKYEEKAPAHGEKCVSCGKAAKHWAYVARQY
ncbi:MAG: His/Gly/Thr/Pro-type tRNA ligase C-terminal domain-containing protein [Candidatus Micrarchaeota archaeon]